MAELLVWDATGERDIESGISKVVLFPKAANRAAGAGTGAAGSGGSEYEAGIAWSGVTAVSENPGGADVTDLYADNIKYASLRAAETFGFTIEAYTYPDEWEKCDGSANAGVTGVSIGQQARQAFGLCYRTEVGSDSNPGMDKGYKLHIVYNSTASPSSRSYSTINNSPDAISFSWEANSTPVNVDIADIKPTCLITIDTTKLTNGKNNTNLKSLETILYGVAGSGSGGTDARLPDPKEVLTVMGYSGS